MEESAHKKIRRPLVQTQEEKRLPRAYMGFESFVYSMLLSLVRGCR